MLVPRGLRLQVGRNAIGDVGVSTINIHPAKQVMIHIIAVGVFVLAGNSDVLVQVKRPAT
jgi:hypothetical protein